MEAKLKDSKPKPFGNNPSPINTNPGTSRFPNTTSTTPNTTPPIRKLTRTQLQERRTQGLCYNCDEKFIPGHKCAPPKFLLLMTEDDDPNTTDPLVIEEIQDSDHEPLHFQLSPEAVNGHASPRVLKFSGLILGLQVNVLVDIGSSHNIIQPRLAITYIFNYP